jgi:dynein light chain LC8-type
LHVSPQQIQAAQAIQKYPDDTEASMKIKQYLDGKYGPNWHCVVGKHFAHFGSYDEGTYHSVHIGQIAVLVYRLS